MLGHSKALSRVADSELHKFLFDHGGELKKQQRTWVID